MEGRTPLSVSTTVYVLNIVLLLHRQRAERHTRWIKLVQWIILLWLTKHYFHIHPFVLKDFQNHHMQIWLRNLSDPVNTSQVVIPPSTALRDQFLSWRCEDWGHILRCQNAVAEVSRSGTQVRLAEYWKKIRPAIITNMEINELMPQDYEDPDNEKNRIGNFPLPPDLNFIHQVAILLVTARLHRAGMSLHTLCPLTRIFCSPVIILMNSCSPLNTVQASPPFARFSDLPWQRNPVYCFCV